MWCPSDIQKKKGLGVIAISSQHCLREASAELDKHLSCWTFLIPASSFSRWCIVDIRQGLTWPRANAPTPQKPPRPYSTLALLSGYRRPLLCKGSGGGKESGVFVGYKWRNTAVGGSWCKCWPKKRVTSPPNCTLLLCAAIPRRENHINGRGVFLRPCVCLR